MDLTRLVKQPCTAAKPKKPIHDTGGFTM